MLSLSALREPPMHYASAWKWEYFLASRFPRINLGSRADKRIRTNFMHFSRCTATQSSNITRMSNIKDSIRRTEKFEINGCRVNRRPDFAWANGWRKTNYKQLAGSVSLGVVTVIFREFRSYSCLKRLCTLYCTHFAFLRDEKVFALFFSSSFLRCSPANRAGGKWNARRSDCSDVFLVITYCDSLISNLKLCSH